jgi:hypothetical protein
VGVPLADQAVTMGASSDGQWLWVSAAAQGEASVDGRAHQKLLALYSTVRAGRLRVHSSHGPSSVFLLTPSLLLRDLFSDC